MNTRLIRSVLLCACFTMFAAGFCLSLAGCNTIEGAGEDVEAAGEGISDASRDVRD